VKTILVLDYAFCVVTFGGSDARLKTRKRQGETKHSDWDAVDQRNGNVIVTQTGGFPGKINLYNIIISLHRRGGDKL